MVGNKWGFSNVFFIGIGGISMSGLAEILLSDGLHVSGSDVKVSDMTEHLVDLGISVFIGHSASNISGDVDLVVYTAAVKSDNPELIEARKRNIPIMDRAFLLGIVMKRYRYSIAVSGAHGKTTTTSMLGLILMQADVSPSISVGGVLDSIGGNTFIGNGNFFVAEACEYCDSFLKLAPFMGVILNVDMDHSDYFKDIFHLRQSFLKFASLISPTGFLVINAGIDNVGEFLENTLCNVITFGFDNCSGVLPLFTVADVSYDCKGCASFVILLSGVELCRVSLRVPGEFNVLNALAACAAAYYLGIDVDDIVSGLQNYSGTQRRFEFKGYFNSAVVYDDYAHHPTEIISTLKAASKFSYNRLWCVFQPHTFSRTKSFLDDFAKSFSRCDKIIVTDIFAAREVDPGDISSADIVDKILDLGGDAVYIKEFSDIENYLIHNLTNDDMLITMGAGDVYLVGEHLLS